jgi:hypothetical protein
VSSVDAKWLSRKGRIAGEALRQCVQGLQAARGLRLPAAGDVFAERPADPAGQAGVGGAETEPVAVGGRGERAFDDPGGAVEIVGQRGFQRVGDLHRACLHLQRVEAVERPPFEAAAVEAAPGTLQVLAAGAHQGGIDQVLERFGHRTMAAAAQDASVSRPPVSPADSTASSCTRLRTSVWLCASTRRRSVAGPPIR